MRTSFGGGPTRALVMAATAAAALSLTSGAAQAQRQERQGKQVVEAVCASCHANGKNDAPRIGDAKAWSARASQGLTALTDHALKGIRAMPAHGGNPGVSDIEVERAIIYMVNHSGGHWVEPVGGATPALVRTSEGIVQGQCSKCHEAGVEGAPKIGDRSAWVPRLSRGLNTLVASAIHGHGPMPARGGLAELSDDEIRGAIVYMFNYGVPVAAPAAPPPPPDPRHKVVANTDIYFGMMTAASARASLGTAAEVPSGKGYYHVNISLADTRSHVPVTDAQVQVRVSDGMNDERKPLGLVAANNTVSYGNFFKLESGNAYNLIAEIKRPGVPGTIEAKFQFKAP